jgi:hypothetical protein
MTMSVFSVPLDMVILLLAGAVLGHLDTIVQTGGLKGMPREPIKRSP